MSNEKDKNQKHEHGKHVLHLTLNGKQYKWHQQYITGAEIRNLGNIPTNEDIFLAIKKPWEDEPIADDKQVNLARPEIEHFYSTPKEVVIIVNGTPHKWNKSKISIKEVIILAFGQYIDKPTMVYTVAYEDGPKQNPEGSMFAGQEVFVKNKMVFHATATDKS
ncbi:MAG: multiubiquitin domain-containing protein [Bacteroidota bacterium]